MTWTRFMDMHSGGGAKTDYEYIYIEADEDTAINVFCNLFDEHPYSVACHCCGSNFSISCYDSLEEATAYERRKENLEDFVARLDVKVVYLSEITPNLLEEDTVVPYEDVYYDDEDF